MPLTKLKEYLDSNKVRYITLQHSKAFTAQEIASLAHISGKLIAKTVMILIDGNLAMCVLPADLVVDFGLLRSNLGTQDVKLAAEYEFRDRFPDCEVGAMPPFGNIYGMQVLVEESLTEDDFICFNACNHTEMVQMEYNDYERLVGPRILEFSYK